MCKTKTKLDDYSNSVYTDVLEWKHMGVAWYHLYVAVLTLCINANITV